MSSGRIVTINNFFTVERTVVWATPSQVQGFLAIEPQAAFTTTSATVVTIPSRDFTWLEQARERSQQFFLE